uniref:Exocrine gland-secreting peptide 28 n=1 Tax=Mus musculus TaxID=10090 RepID=A8R0W0_MOUSE|nr:exocrine gland-secreting peptide 28 [Mus musculus]
MCFLIILLLLSMLTEGMVLKQTQKDFAPSADQLALFVDCQYLTYTIPEGHELFLGLNQAKILLEFIPHNIECL